ncbi:hypothetical protein LQF60_03090 [Tetragenococcus koreensis]|uniref:hypothetical protein n=1 Tax=Tetragenococcus koreensis TaxID=290335 RepID=UPI001F3B34A1|nr:hypothetical protein [Tetragenococcus koreensis]MCF1585200.1 hypothetical protein [Tetragenococcus koreensis]MCF1614812.1 hypothetical protein [Tetragenococcus koreensis]MCF1624624.1 hypothetical protein [Tetragenococcus koreensis]MCF1628824.1 hypothetical protein [Tetragenococcus koreensis]MDN6345480.1 hypothetical protein [Tetragenococcus koreensis]
MELTQEEMKVIELYRNSESAAFHRYFDTEQEALDFTSIYGKPYYYRITEDLSAYQSIEVPKKLEVISFLNDEAFNELERKLKKD